MRYKGTLLNLGVNEELCPRNYRYNCKVVVCLYVTDTVMAAWYHVGLVVRDDNGVRSMLGNGGLLTSRTSAPMRRDSDVGI